MDTSTDTLRRKRIDAVNAILSAVNSTVEDVDATSAAVLIACTELIRQTVEHMPPDVRADIIAGVAGALAADNASLLQTVWGDWL